MTDFNIKDIRFPLETVKVKVGLRGMHYHLSDCPVCDRSIFINADLYDYLELEVPKQLVDIEADFDYLYRSYRSHIPMCKVLIGQRKGGK